MTRKWNFIEIVERINLFENYPSWEEVHFKNINLNVAKQRAFSALICCPDEKVFLLGGQVMEDGKSQLTSNVVEVDMESHTLINSELTLPSPCAFFDSNFYFFNANAVNFDNDGSIFFYSNMYKEVFNIETR
jgi:hypothetical protein